MVRILIVDDDAIGGRLTQRRLQNAGHDVALRTGPMGAFADLKNGNFDLLLLDLRMPALSGVDIVRMARSRRGVSTKIVLFSSTPEDELAEIARSLGVEGYLSKSADTPRLLEMIRAVVDQPVTSA